MGDMWSSGRGKHGVAVECKGWCLAKKNKRKRWNYCSANNCELFDMRKKKGIIMSGNGCPTPEQVATICAFIEENLG